VQDLCGVHLTQQSKESLHSLMGTETNSKLRSGAQPCAANLFVSSFKVVASDIDKMSVKVKKMGTVALAEANALALKSQQEVGDEAERLFKRCVMHSLHRSSPTSPVPSVDAEPQVLRSV
jgi:hypothetical protein